MVGFKDIIDEDGRFDGDEIEDRYDGREVAEECFKIIHHLTKGDPKQISDACYETGVRDPYCPDTSEGVVPPPMRTDEPERGFTPEML